MGIKTWAASENETSTIVAVDSEAVYLLTIKKSLNKAALQQLQTRLLAGEAANALGASKVVAIPFSDLRRIHVSENWDAVEFYYPHAKDESKDRFETFKTDVGFKPRLAMAQEIADATGRRIETSTADASLFSVLFAPVIFAGMTVIFTWVIYTAAVDLEAGKEVVAKGRRAGIKQLFIWLASVLGSKVTLIIGGVCLVAALCVAVAMLKKRPQVHKLEFGASVAS